MGGPGSGRKKGSGGKSKKAESFSVSPSKIKNKPIPASLKKKFMKEGGINSPSYKAWIKKNWKT